MAAESYKDRYISSMEARVSALEARRQRPAEGPAAAAVPGIPALPERARGLPELIGHALTDASFRQELFADRSKAIEGFQLTASEQEALDSLSQETLEQHAQRFGDAGRAGLTISVSIKGTF